MSARYDIVIDRGADTRLYLIAKTNGVADDLTGVTAVLTICADGAAGTPINLVVGPQAGTVHIHLPDTLTALLEGGPSYQVDLTYPSGDIRRLLHGHIVEDR